MSTLTRPKNTSGRLVDNSAETMLKVSALAAKLECFTEEDFQQLAGATASTVEAWRKRGTGPAYVRLGNRFYYPHSAVAEYFESVQRKDKSVVKASL